MNEVKDTARVVAVTAHDLPLHCIEKVPKLAAKQGAYSVTGTDGRILKRGHDLAAVLKVLEKKRPKLRVV